MLSSNHSLLPTTRQPFASHDENAVKGATRDVVKTPGTTKARRAFGDISNKRQPVAEKETGKVSFNPLPKTPSVRKSGQVVEVKKEIVKTPHPKFRPTEAKSERRVEFDLPTKAAPEDDWMLDDIAPAGRTYDQQFLLDDVDDDDASDLTLDLSDLRKDFDLIRPGVANLKPYTKEKHLFLAEQADNEGKVFGKQLEPVDSPDSIDLVALLDELDKGLDDYPSHFDDHFPIENISFG